MHSVPSESLIADMLTGENGCDYLGSTYINRTKMMDMSCKEHIKIGKLIPLEVGTRVHSGMGSWSSWTEGAHMLQQPHVFPSMPPIGQSESFYANLAKQADAEGNMYAHEAAKVGQYITLALDPHLEWPAKQRYFEHALQAALCSTAGSR